MYEIEFICPKCKHNWTAPSYEELGASFLINEDDQYCSECGTTGVGDGSEEFIKLEKE